MPTDFDGQAWTALNCAQKWATELGPALAVRHHTVGAAGPADGVAAVDVQATPMTKLAPGLHSQRTDATCPAKS